MQKPTSSEQFLTSFGLRWDTQAQGFELLEASRLSLPLSDLGAMHGAILVERIRSFGQQLLDLQPHLARLGRGMDLLGLDSNLFLRQLEASIAEMLAKSQALLKDQSDASLCVVVTPGDFFSGKQIHGFVHWLPIPWRKLAHWYQFGTTLVRVQYASGAGECWPSNIKSRSRLNYSSRLNRSGRLRGTCGIGRHCCRCKINHSFRCWFTGSLTTTRHQDWHHQAQNQPSM